MAKRSTVVLTRRREEKKKGQNRYVRRGHVYEEILAMLVLESNIPITTTSEPTEARKSIWGQIMLRFQQRTIKPDVRPRPARKTRPAKKTKSETTGSSEGSVSGSISDSLSEDLRRKLQATSSAYKEKK
ncbi:hypothetical protein Tco_0773472 [Tanacetum coccineum]|uniref:Uncharacterized protein n=1 Tax=Tanacetum coccineum TaxID=301880 RepID=A0ABQ4ZN32_9ASTR